MQPARASAPLGQWALAPHPKLLAYQFTQQNLYQAIAVCRAPLSTGGCPTNKNRHGPSLHRASFQSSECVRACACEGGVSLIPIHVYVIAN